MVDGSFLRELFLQRLLTNVRMVLASAHDDSTSIEKLAQLVDKAVKVVAPTSVSSVSASQVTEELERLHVEVSDLKILVKSIPPTASGRRGHHRSHSRGHSPSPHPIQNQNTNITDSPVCWYHSHYGKDARKCKPCSAGNKLASRQRRLTLLAYYQVACFMLPTAHQDFAFLLIPVLKSVSYHPPGPKEFINKTT